MKTVGTIIDYGLYRLIMFVLDLRNNRRFEKTYGDFRLRDNYDPLTVKKLHSESGIILGSIAQFIREIGERVALAGLQQHDHDQGNAHDDVNDDE